MADDTKKFNLNLMIVILAVVAVVSVRLFWAADEFDNWKGFWISLFHIVVVGIGAFFAIRKKRTDT